MQTGTIISGTGHAALILWVVLGDWLFSAQDVPPVQVAEVSLISSAEFDAMAAAVPSTPEPVQAPEPAPDPTPPEQAQTEPASAPEAISPPEPVQPDTEPLPENNGVADAEPLPVNPDAAPEVPLPITEAPRPKPAPRVAPVPVDAPEPQTEVSETPQEAVAPEPVEQPVVQQEEQQATVEEEAGTVLETEANRDQQVDASGAPATSPRPKGKPVRRETPPDETATAAAEDPAQTQDDLADAIAGAVAEASTDTPAETPAANNAPAGPPMTVGEKDALRVSVQRCWNVGSLSTEALRVTVVVAVSVAQNGVPDAGSIRMLEFDGGSEAAARQAYEAARRAVIRCGASGFPLPAEKYDQWREMELVFNPEGMRLR